MPDCNEELATFEVELILHICGYEKTAKHTVSAPNADKAKYEALLNETHNEPLTYEEFMNGDEWEDDFMIYNVYSVTLVV